MSLYYQDADSYAELIARLERTDPGIQAHIDAVVAEAGPIPEDAQEVIRRVFAGAGTRILQRRQQNAAAA